MWKFLLILFVFTTPYTSFVYTQLQNGSEVSLEVISGGGISGQTYTINLKSFDFDIKKSDISWTLDGVLIKKGFGASTVSVSVNNQKQNLLLVSVKTPTGEVYNKSQILVAKRVSLVWEPLDSYTPDWYEGGAYLARAGAVRLYALAEISSGKSALSSSDLKYTWEVNNEIVDAYSGVGRDYMDYNTKDVQGNEIEFTVTVSSKDSKDASDAVVANLTLEPKDPEVLIYKQSPVYGILSQNALLGTIKNYDKNFTLIAEPFYFSTDPEKISKINYTWRSNGKTLANSNSFARIFKIPDNATGITEISVAVKHISKIFQDISSKVNISF